MVAVAPSSWCGTFECAAQEDTALNERCASEHPNPHRTGVSGVPAGSVHPGEGSEEVHGWFIIVLPYSNQAVQIDKSWSYVSVCGGKCLIRVLVLILV